MICKAWLQGGKRKVLQHRLVGPNACDLVSTLKALVAMLSASLTWNIYVSSSAMLFPPQTLQAAAAYPANQNTISIHFFPLTVSSRKPKMYPFNPILFTLLCAGISTGAYFFPLYTRNDDSSTSSFNLSPHEDMQLRNLQARAFDEYIFDVLLARTAESEAEAAGQSPQGCLPGPVFTTFAPRDVQEERRCIGPPTYRTSQVYPTPQRRSIPVSASQTQTQTRRDTDSDIRTIMRRFNNENTARKTVQTPTNTKQLLDNPVIYRRTPQTQQQDLQASAPAPAPQALTPAQWNAGFSTGAGIGGGMQQQQPSSGQGSGTGQQSRSSMTGKGMAMGGYTKPQVDGGCTGSKCA